MLTVNDRAKRIATFRGIEVFLMEMIARWIPTTPEMELKVLLGKHVWDVAQHADALGKRTWELRRPMHFTLTPVEDYVRILEDVAKEESSAARIAGLYHGIIPSLERRYEAYLSATDDLLDAPSVVIVKRILDSYTTMKSEAEEKIDQLDLDLSAASPAVDEFSRRESGIESLVAEREVTAS